MDGSMVQNMEPNWRLLAGFMEPPMADRSVNYALRAMVINAAKPRAKPYVLTDGGGLYVEVLATGSKVWRYSYRLGSRRPKLTIGPYPEIGIADARDKHAQLRALVVRGVDPIKFTREAEASGRQKIGLESRSLHLPSSGSPIPCFIGQRATAVRPFVFWMPT